MGKSLLDQVKGKGKAKKTPTEDVEDIFADVEEVTPEIVKNPKIKKETPKPQPKKEQEYPMEIVTQEHAISTPVYNITKADVKAHLDMYKFVKNQIIDTTDFAEVKGRKFLKKSGVRKFINAFGISVELVEKRVFELNNDTHAEVRVRAITQKGQFVEGIGLKSMSELYDKTLHNLISTAWTRAVNRAILDLVAFGEVSAEEVIDNGEKEDWLS